MNALGDLLLAIFRRLEQQRHTALVRFGDGTAYELRVISTAHTEAGGDIVADVLRVASPAAAGVVSSGDCMNFLLSDVVQVSVDGECVYSHATADEAGAAPNRDDK